MKRHVFVLSSLVLAALALSACAPVSRPVALVWEGAPQIGPGQARGYFLWHDEGGWHVRWTTRGQRHNFSGKLKCDGAFDSFTPISTERGDHIKMANRAAITFNTSTTSGTDGFDFRLTRPTSHVTFDLYLDGQRIYPAEIFLGSSMAHPPGNPFTLDRGRQ